MERALVTGATGTVGSAVVRALRDAEVKVRPLVRGDADVDGAEVARGSLDDAEPLRRAVDGCALVVHCAAEVSNDSERCQRVNVDGTRRLVEAMTPSRPRLVHISTASVYDYRGRLDFDEEAAMWSEPLDAYGWTKAEAERIVRRAVVLAARSDVAVGRVYNVIDGDGDRREYADAVYAALGQPTPPLAPAPHLRFAGARIRAELGWEPVDRWREFIGELAAARDNVGA